MRIKNGKRTRNKSFEQKVENSLDPRKTKMVVEFDYVNSPSIKSFAVKKQNKIKTNTCFMSGKLLMFAKLSSKSFVYELTEIFCFSNETVKKNFDKYLIEKVEIFHVLMDTDSPYSLFFYQILTVKYKTQNLEI